MVHGHAPLTVYVHCHAHHLNLILVDTCKAVPEVRQFFGGLEELYIFTSGSLMHQKWLAVQARMYPDEPSRQLQCLSDTH